jgi:hypothetical protein
VVSDVSTFSAGWRGKPMKVIQVDLGLAVEGFCGCGLFVSPYKEESHDKKNRSLRNIFDCA